MPCLIGGPVWTIATTRTWQGCHLILMLNHSFLISFVKPFIQYFFKTPKPFLLSCKTAKVVLFLWVPCTRAVHIIELAQTGIPFCFLHTLPATAIQTSLRWLTTQPRLQAGPQLVSCGQCHYFTLVACNHYFARCDLSYYFAVVA